MSEDRASSFLQMIRRSQRGRLKIYLGFAPGVGKTYLMLQEAHRLLREGVDVVVGMVEHHGRADTMALVDGLPRVPMRPVDYHGIRVEEMDLAAVLARRPQVVLVDELAHTNVPGSRNAKRYDDVRELVAAGIHVISTMNVQHLESLYDTVEAVIGVKVRERVPDAVLAEADQVVNVDLAAEDLQKRLRDGKIYPLDRVDSSLGNFFTESNLQHLRELALRELAGQLDLRRREAGPAAGEAAGGGGLGDQVMVCLSSRGPNSARLLRHGSRLAGRLNRDWYAVYVQTPREEPTVIDAATQRTLGDTLTLANRLGATVFTFKGADVPDTLLRFAKEYRVGQIVIGSPRPLPWWRRVLLGRRSVAEELILRQRNVTVIVVDAEQPDDAAPPPPAPTPPAPTPSAEPPFVRPPLAMASVLRPESVLFFDAPVGRDALIAALATAALSGTTDAPHAAAAVRLVEEREARGSTFLNEGVALPHARVPEISTIRAAIAVLRGGVGPEDSAAVRIAFLVLTPATGNTDHLRLLASAGRLLGSKQRRQQLLNSPDAVAVLDALQG